MSRGYAFLAEIVGILDKQPRTLAELYDLVPNIGKIPLGRIVAELVAGRVIRVCDYRRGSVNRGKPSRVFGVGGEAGVEPPPRLDGRPSRAPATPAVPKRGTSNTVVGRFCALWHALETPASAREVGRRAGVAEHVCRLALHEMRRAKLAKIDSEVRESDSGIPTALWVRGKGGLMPRRLVAKLAKAPAAMLHVAANAPARLAA